MEWSKTTISKAELERKQKEYIEAALGMAKRAVNVPSAETKTAEKAAIVEELVEETDDLSGMLEEIGAEVETTEEPVEIIEEKAEVPEEIAEPEEISEPAEEKAEEIEELPSNYGVFDTEQLMSAIESGEVSGEGLKQAAEILEEMTRKTDTMKKLIEEQETEDFSDNGEDYGLNSFINRHNSNCRGCTDGNADTP